MTGAPETPPPAAPARQRAAFVASLIFAVLTLAACLCAPVLANTRWPAALFLLSAFAATLLALARNLPWQNVLSAAALIAAISGFAHALNAKTGLPFGARVDTDALGPRLFGVLPWPVPLIWIVAILNSRGVARLILRPWRRTPNYGFRVIGLACLLTVVFDLGLEPWAGEANVWWFWQMPRSVPAWHHAPWVNFLGWTVTTLLILAFVTPWLINKKPVPPPPPDYQPLVLWLLLNLLPAAGCAAHHLWSAAAATALAAAIVTTFALRNARA
jgi:uncharacterized membrane protein